MTILDEKDWSRVQSALERMESIEIERVYQPLDVRVVVNTSLVDKPWTVAMIVTVKAYFRGGEWHQHCESVEQAKRVLKEWNGWARNEKGQASRCPMHSVCSWNAISRNELRITSELNRQSRFITGPVVLL